MLRGRRRARAAPGRLGRMRFRRAPTPLASSCAPCLPELQRIVLRCVGDPVATAAVLDEAVARAAQVAPLPTGPALRRLLFQLVHEVLLERRRNERARPSRPLPVRGSSLSEGGR